MSPSKTKRPSRASSRSPSRLHGRMCGSARFANGHLQASGRDAKGRKQYRYHPRGARCATRPSTAAWSCSRRRCRASASGSRRISPRPAHNREKVLAIVVRLLESTFIRVGNEEYARTNKSFGLTTMQDRHVKIDGSQAAVPLPRQERQEPPDHAHQSPAGAPRRRIAAIFPARISSSISTRRASRAPSTRAT